MGVQVLARDAAKPAEQYVSPNLDAGESPIDFHFLHLGHSVRYYPVQKLKDMLEVPVNDLSLSRKSEEVRILSHGRELGLGAVRGW